MDISLEQIANTLNVSKTTLIAGASFAAALAGIVFTYISNNYGGNKKGYNIRTLSEDVGSFSKKFEEYKGSDE